ncbi:MAG: hypothetical protein HRU27_01650 [Rhizobiaceae bacterium]|nr:hypothetical protein [Hyphomicrobiales bacterium]NRB29282.1 hypothetical protein [Rhizobiaceae bacterium]
MFSSYSIVGDSAYLPGEYSAVNELKARENLRSGRSSSFHITLLSGPCICCPEEDDKAQAWKAAGGPFRKSDTLFDNRTAVSFNTPNDAADDPEDIFTLDPQLTTLALDGEPKLPNLRKPPFQRVVQPICKKCKALADRRNQLGSRYNDLRETYLNDYGEGSRLYRVYANYSGESARIEKLATRPGVDGVERDRQRLKKANAILIRANKLIKSGREAVEELQKSEKQLEQLDAELLECDQLPCEDPAPQPDAVVQQEADPSPPPGAQELLTFYALIGSKLGSYDAALAPGFGGNFANGTTFSNPTLGFGFLYSPFETLPLYFGLEGAAFLGSRGEIITVNLHPTAGNDTRVSAEPETALRFSVGTTIPFEGGCITRFQCYSIDVEGGLTLEQIRYTFSTDESGGGGVNNSFSGNFNRLGFSVGAALNLPACQFIEMACNLVFAPYLRATFFNGGGETFQHTSANLNNVYQGRVKAERQVEAGLRLLFKF